PGLYGSDSDPFILPAVPQRPDMAGNFQRQTMRLLEHQNHVQDAWDPDYAADQPPQ
ncbi:hypothetical protein A2U01_0107189, partial [Trifolium medium]|nr:hypothetical protein [Trifolium medium]